MAMQNLNFPETPLKLEKFKKIPQINHRSLKTFWAFLLSIFIYISIFYMFNLSPSISLFSTTKFWFFISNTLILIIAVDSYTFSSSKEHDFYEEDCVCVKQNDIARSSKSTTTVPSFEEHRYVGLIVEKKTLNDLKSTPEIDETVPKEKIINIVSSTTTCEYHNNNQIEEYKPAELIEIKNKQEMIFTTETGNGLRRRVRKKRAAKCSRSNSDKTVIMAAVAAEEKENEGKYALQRTMSEERHDDDHESLTSEENEFSKMSNEELNERVEEFIRRFNRQIRLQASCRELGAKTYD